MSDVITSLLPALNTAAAVGSTGYNLYNQYQNQQYQNTLRSDAQNPQKVNALAAQYTQPLNAGLTAAVNNQTQAQLAQAGLSESPEIAQTVEAQAIAPYIQQNQQAGYANAIQALGLGGGAIPPQQQQQNSAAALAKSLSLLGQGGQNPGQLQLLNYLRTMGTSAPQLNQNQFSPGAAPSAPIDTSSWDAATPDLSSFYQQNYFAPAGVDPSAD